MIDGRDQQQAPGSPVPVDLRAVAEALATLERPVTDDAVRVGLIRDLEVLTCAATGAQAALSVDLAASQVEREAAAGVRPAHQGRGVAAQVGLARRESGHRGRFHLGLARLVLADLPSVAAAWRSGRISEHRVQLVAKQVCCLARPERLALDARMAGTPELVTSLEEMGDRALDATAAQVAYELDKHAFLARRERAVAERRTSLRPAPDGMTWFSALLPLRDGVALHASLSAAATTARTAGDLRGRGQVMADTLVDRVTGRSEETPVPVPADVAREWIDGGGDAVTYQRMWADVATGQVVGTESRSASRCYPTSLATHARRRDRVCRMPWCDAPVRHVDHAVDAAAGGATSIQNAGGVCEDHNYAKQAPGWSAETSRDPDGTHVITYTTPTGHTVESRPPPSYPPREQRRARVLRCGVGTGQRPPPNERSTTVPSVERTVTVDQPIEKVWAYISDFRSSEQWDPPSVSTERTSGDGGVGTTYHNVSSFLGSEQEVTYEVVEHVPPQQGTPGRFVMTGDAGSIKLRDTITFVEDAPGRTSVTYHAEFIPDGAAAKLATPVMPAALKVLGDKVAASMEEHLRAL